MSAIVQLGRFRIGQTVTYRSGEETRSGELFAYRQEETGFVLFVREPHGGIASVREAEVVETGPDGTPGPEGTVAGVSGIEARLLARQILDGVAVRWPVQAQLRTLAMAVLGQPAPAAEPDPGAPGLAQASGTGGRS